MPKKHYFFRRFHLNTIFHCSILLVCLFSLVQCLPAEELKCHVEITPKYVVMDEVRDRLSLEYIREHYGLTPRKPHIDPRFIVLHWTGIDSFSSSYNTMHPSTLGGHRTDIAQASNLNVCAHFLVDRDGSIFKLLPLPYFGRHVIGLNYHAIGVENVGTDSLPLTNEQVAANVALIQCLLEKYPEIQYVIGHYEYRLFENTPYFLEIDPKYRTVKTDPGKDFMKKVRKRLKKRYSSGRLKTVESIEKK